MSKRFLLGIAGGSGSGKTTIVDRLMQSPFRSKIALLRHDAYYFNGDQMPADLRSAGNWDHPATLDNECFIEHMDQLLSGEAVEQPVYDFATHSRTERVEVIEPRPVILLEGILLLALPEIRRRLDLAVFIDTPPEERIVRRMMRDIAERNRTIPSVAEQFRSTVRPMHDHFVEPSRVHANIVVPWDWGVDNTAAIEVILARIEVSIAQYTR